MISHTHPQYPRKLTKKCSLGYTCRAHGFGPLPGTCPKTMGAHKKKGRLRCHKRPKSREETPKKGSDSGSATAHPS